MNTTIKDGNYLSVEYTVSYKDIPITERKQVVEFESGYSNGDDLPF
jgi:hypothetical protein